MESRNQNVVQGGGIFHTPKVKYSPETRSFLKELMEESKMTNMQRKKINYSLRSGDPLPSLKSQASKKSKFPEVIIRPGSSKRRTFDTIKASGAFDRERFVPSHPRVNRDFAKKHLQDLMAYGKEIREGDAKPKNVEATSKFSSRYDELKHEIQDRVEWLADMEKLGEGYKHRQVIEQQIAARIREIERLKVTQQEEECTSES